MDDMEDPFAGMEFDPNADGFDFDVDDADEEPDQEATWNATRAENAIYGVTEETGGVTVTGQEARKSHFLDVQRMENSGNKGLVFDGKTEVFRPFKSIEGRGPDKNMSEYEIGYGIKVHQDWLSDDRKKWPTLHGVPLNIKKGITKDQAEEMSQEILGKSYKAAEKTLGSWDKYTEMEKVYWADLTYNGGDGAIAKNPKALAAAKSGYTVEGMIRTFDFIKAGAEKSRGLLNRRISMYNQAALETPGAPIVEKYEFGKEIKVKFSSKFMTKKVSEKFSKKVNENGGWYTITSGNGDEVVVRDVEDNFKFTA